MTRYNDIVDESVIVGRIYLVLVLSPLFVHLYNVRITMISQNPRVMELQDYKAASYKPNGRVT